MKYIYNPTVLILTANFFNASKEHGNTITDMEMVILRSLITIL